MKKGSTLDFNLINLQALNIVELIKKKKSKLLEVLTRYETYKTAEDEINRTLDLLTSLNENKEYFKKAVGPIAAFMPSNQPLYSFSCFAIVPALMSEKVCVKAPEIMSGFYEDMLEILEIQEQPFSIEFMKLPRWKCVELFSEIKINQESKIEEPVFDAVIFTGTSKNADFLRKRFHKSVLFIANGAGHNPLIVTDTADIDKAVESIMSVGSYNQGQDCASPNSILVHAEVYAEVIKRLRREVLNLNIGPYNSPKTDIGPISRPDTLVSVTEFLRNNASYIDKTTEGVIRSSTCFVEPTIITKPLSAGANFDEVFAPIFIIQKYDADEELKLYFEDEKYPNNGMYITIFGKSDYIEYFISQNEMGRKLHDKSTIIYNTDLHKPGIERGVLPYGGYGRGASCVSKDGVIISKPTLPQRDIYEYLVEGKPIEDANHSKKTINKVNNSELNIENQTINLDDLLNLYTPEMLRWLFAKHSSEKFLKTSAIRDINRYYDEYDAALESLKSGSTTRLDIFLLKITGVNTRNSKPPVSFRQVLGLGQSVHWDMKKLKAFLKLKGLKYNIRSINERLPKVKFWIEKYNTQELISLRKENDEKYFQNISELEIQHIRELCLFLSKYSKQNLSLEDIEYKLYEIPKSQRVENIEIKQMQRKFFKNLYNLLIGNDTGPRLSTFIWAADQKNILKLLDNKIV